LKYDRDIIIVGCHAEGEVGDVIVAGIDPPPGATVWDQSRFIAEDQTLRNFVLNEPRGGVFRHVNLIVPATDPRADMGFIIMEPADTPPMSGSNCMCVTTVLLETGMLPMQEPETNLVLEAPGGLINVFAECRNGKVEQVRLQNVPSFVARRDASLEVEGLGTLRVDTAFGGDSFVMVEADDLDLAISPDEGDAIRELGRQITDAANRQLGFDHPGGLAWDHISFCQIHRRLADENGVRAYRNAVVVQPGKIDRSPTGTGVSARLALMHAKGEIAVGEPVIARSIIDSQFGGRIVSETHVGKTPAIVPEISGRAWRTGRTEHRLDPTDPWPSGYRIGDTWPT